MNRARLCLLQNLEGTCPQCPPVPTSLIDSTFRKLPWSLVQGCLFVAYWFVNLQFGSAGLGHFKFESGDLPTCNPSWGGTSSCSRVERRGQGNDFINLACQCALRMRQFGLPVCLENASEYKAETNKRRYTYIFLISSRHCVHLLLQLHLSPDKESLAFVWNTA